MQEKEVAPIIADYWERAEFPHELVPKLAKLNLGGATLKGNGCAGQSLVGAAMAVIEIARVDGSMSTFLMVRLWQLLVLCCLDLNVMVRDGWMSW